MVVTHTEGLQRLLRFLRNLAVQCVTAVSAINVTLHTMHLVLQNGLTVADLNKALVEHRFRMRPSATTRGLRPDEF